MVASRQAEAGKDPDRRRRWLLTGLLVVVWVAVFGGAAAASAFANGNVGSGDGRPTSTAQERMLLSLLSAAVAAVLPAGLALIWRDRRWHALTAVVGLTYVGSLLAQVL